ncbi:MAG: hypothetical protein KIS62_05295 [Ramlibacter sp.]|nr:hypothetical protein [Ramlibacter sp.]MBX3657418.1 hypothetical protein [Ramlibacter sp.]MCW5649140.1 hypothetical protein [Ramlibacter sp.]
MPIVAALTVPMDRPAPTPRATPDHAPAWARPQLAWPFLAATPLARQRKAHAVMASTYRS